MKDPLQEIMEEGLGIQIRTKRNLERIMKATERNQ